MNYKPLAALAAVAALAAPTAATAAPAKGKTKTEHVKKAKKAKNAVFKGTVSAVDAGAGTITVTVAKGNKWARAYKDSFASGLTFKFDATKKVGGVEDVNADGKKTLADVVAGNLVLVQARVTKDTAVEDLTARKVNVSTPETDDQD